jgi:hypothetical protein
MLFNYPQLRRKAFKRLKSNQLKNYGRQISDNYTELQLFSSGFGRRLSK